jgi:catechol 2,3-dioxygenase-like lactoylglutathione lyase family enzyme
MRSATGALLVSCALCAGSWFPSACAAQSQLQSPELAGIAHVALRVADIEKSRDFYRTLGFEEAFSMNQGGTPTEAFLKVNDRQFIELYPQRQSSQPIGFMHVCFESNDLEALNRFYLAGGLSPIPVRRAGAGNLLFTLAGPEQQNIEYTQYMPGSRHWNDRGQHLSANRISGQIIAVGIEFRDLAAALAFYEQRLGFAFDPSVDPWHTWLRIPGSSHQLVEMEPQPPGAAFELFLLAPDLRHVAAELKSLHIATEKRRSMLSIQDPDGNRIVFLKAPTVGK